METFIILFLLFIIGFMCHKYNIKMSEFNSSASEIVRENELILCQNEELEDKVATYKINDEVLRNTIVNLKELAPDVSSMIDRNTYKDIVEVQTKTQDSLVEYKGKYDKMVSEKKSKEVRLGQISETLIPFLSGFNHDPKTLKPMFQPIDYIAFGEDYITFIEVKSGGSQLSKKQREIKRMVEEGKVKFEIHRINEQGLTIK